MDAPANPLLDFDGLPRFDAIRPEHVTPAVDALVAQARAAVERVATDPRPATWESVVEPVTDAFDHLGRAWGTVAYLNAVVNTPELRDAYNTNQPKLVDFYTDVAQDLRLYARYRALRERTVVRHARRPSTQADRQRIARFQAGRRRVVRCRKSAAQGAERGNGGPVDAVRGERAGRDQRLVAVRHARRGAGRHSGRCHGCGTRGRRGHWRARLETHVAHAVLPAGDAIRTEPRTAATNASRATSRLHPSSARTPSGTTARSSSASSCCAAKRRGFSGMPITPRFRWCRRWRRPRRKWRRSCATWVPAPGRSRNATTPSSWPLRAAISGLPDLAAWDLAFASEKLKANRFAYSEQDLRPVLPRGPGPRGPLPRHRDDLRRAHTRIKRAEMASVGTILRNHRWPGRARRPVLPRPSCAREQAGRRMDGRCHQPPPQRDLACSIRSPT